MYTEEFLISELHRFVEENGKNPRLKDMKVSEGYISSWEYLNYFGTWNKALEEAGYKKKINENIFNPDNLNIETWYTIGYIIADGCIYNKTLNLCSVDEELMERVTSYLNINYNSNKHLRTSSGMIYTASKTNKQWINDLKIYGIVPRKSFISYLPLEYCKTEDDVRALCLGLFDGDGCITYYKSRSQKKRPVFVIYGSYQVCLDFQKVLKDYLYIDRPVQKHYSINKITISNMKDNEKIYNFLYNNELSNLWLNRKYDKFTGLLYG